MKYLLATFILSVCIITQCFANDTNEAKRCDSLRLTDGRTVAVQILRQTEDRIFIAHCGDETMKERPLLKQFVEAVIVNGRITQEPATYLKSKKRAQKNNRENAKNGAILAGSGLVVIVLYKLRYEIAEALWIGLLNILLD